MKQAEMKARVMCTVAIDLAAGKDEDKILQLGKQEAFDSAAGKDQDYRLSRWEKQ